MTNCKHKIKIRNMKKTQRYISGDSFSTFQASTATILQQLKPYRGAMSSEYSSKVKLWFRIPLLFRRLNCMVKWIFIVVYLYKVIVYNMSLYWSTVFEPKSTSFIRYKFCECKIYLYCFNFVLKILNILKIYNLKLCIRTFSITSKNIKKMFYDQNIFTANSYLVVYDVIESLMIIPFWILTPSLNHNYLLWGTYIQWYKYCYKVVPFELVTNMRMLNWHSSYNKLYEFSCTILLHTDTHLIRTIVKFFF